MLIIAFLCLFYAYNIGWNSHEFAEAARAAVKWPVTSGTVRISRGHKSISQYYDYSVSGRDYRGRLFYLPNANPFNFKGFNYKNGQHVLVYFDPTAPEKSCMTRGLDENEYRMNLVCAFISAIFGISAIGCFINDMTSHKAKLGFR
jgi:hypothetical protein